MADQAAAPSTPAPTPSAAPEPTQTETKTEAQAGEQQQTSEQAKPAEVRKHKFKINGAEREVTEEEALRAAQKYLAGDDRFRAASELEKRVNSVLNSVKQDPIAALQKISKEFGGTDFEDLAVQYLSAKLEEQMKAEAEKNAPPEEKKRLELERQLKEERARREEMEKQAKESSEARVKQQMDALFIQTAQLLPPEMLTSQSAKNAVGRAIVDHWQVALENAEELAQAGVEVTPQKIAESVLEEFRSVSPNYLASLDAGTLRQLLGEKKYKALLAAEQKAAEASAHPALTQEPKVREGSHRESKREQAPSTARLMRSMYFNGNRGS